MSKRALVLAAHLDDEVLGVGGTMARYVAEGNEVFIHILRDGIAERHPGEKREYVKMCAIKSAEVLGVPKENVSFGNFSLYDDFTCKHVLGKKNVLDSVEEVLLKVRPHDVFTMHYGDTHTDHQVVHKATELATMPNGRAFGNIERVLSYETMSSTDQIFSSRTNIFIPNLYVDISSYIATKLKAFSKYDTEIKQSPHPRSIEKVLVRASLRGGEANMKSAEAFCLLRQFVRENNKIYSQNNK